MLLTLMLKSHICGASGGEAVPLHTFLNSPFTVVSIMAKAVAVSLLQYCPQPETVSNVTEMTDKQIDFLATLIHELTEDSLKRRYLLHLILQALTLLCSQPVNADRFASHNIMTELEAMMEHADELENPDIIANVLWIIACGGLKSTTETAEIFEVLPGMHWYVDVNIRLYLVTKYPAFQPNASLEKRKLMFRLLFCSLHQSMHSMHKMLLIC